MSDEEVRKLAAIMFTDMVGYSALSQRDERLAQELLEEHRRLLRGIFPRFHGAEIKTIGDAFLVEFNSALEAAQCAIEIQRTLAKRNADAPANRQIELKIGIHIGDVVHRGGDVYGDGVNIASRIEPLAGGGGICVSMDVERQIRNALEARFEKLAPTELKNISVPMELFRIVLPWEKQVARPLTKQMTPRPRRRSWIWPAAAAILVLITAIGWWWTTAYRKTATQRAESLGPTSHQTSNIAAKSIAVLPFENLSRDPDNAFFADGVQDEILTNLSKIADLKVISRSSVMHYKSGVERDLRKIGEELGVAHLLEGSVQRAANKVRVNAQLIDARNDAHLWAQTYDRDLADVFAIQSEIAKTIADQLQAKLSPLEKSAIERPPTNDISAFDLYTRARNLWLISWASSTGKTDLLQAADLLNQATARDPSFFDAWCQLAATELSTYFLGWDHTPARLAKGEAAVQAAVRLRPNAGETHLARARNLYFGYLEYEGAMAELKVARQTIPNDPWVAVLKGYIERRQGRWDESIEDQKRAIELDPRNILTLQQIAITYQCLRRYFEAKSALARVLAFESNDAVTKVWHAFLEFDSKGDTRPVHQMIESVRATDNATLPTVANYWLVAAMAERDAAAAHSALIAAGDNPITTLGTSDNLTLNRPFIEGLIARLMKDENKARSAFAAARAEQEKVIQAQPNYGPALCVLGLIDAGLGRKEEALREGRRAIELLPAEKDALGGVALVKYFTVIAAWVGEKDLALQQLAIATAHPCDLSYGQLKLLPLWDPLRGDPRFEQIVASLAPKD